MDRNIKRVFSTTPEAWRIVNREGLVVIVPHFAICEMIRLELPGSNVDADSIKKLYMTNDVRPLFEQIEQ